LGPSFYLKGPSLAWTAYREYLEGQYRTASSPAPAFYGTSSAESLATDWKEKTKPGCEAVKTQAGKHLLQNDSSKLAPGP